MDIIARLRVSIGMQIRSWLVGQGAVLALALDHHNDIKALLD